MRTVGLKRACKIFWLICRVRDLAPGGPFMPPLRPQAGASHSGSHEKCDNFCLFLFLAVCQFAKNSIRRCCKLSQNGAGGLHPLTFGPRLPTASKFKVACIEHETGIGHFFK